LVEKIVKSSDLIFGVFSHLKPLCVVGKLMHELSTAAAPCNGMIQLSKELRRI